jgi:hypothetical protein
MAADEIFVHGSKKPRTLCENHFANLSKPAELIG